MKYKKARDRQGEGKDKMKKYDKGGETMPISFALYGDDLAMISMPATFRFISHWYVCIKATNSKV